MSLGLDIKYRRASSDKDLHQILNLQKKNLKLALSEQDKESEGFVSVDHEFGVLKRMNDACAHIIAISEEKIVGYTLCMLTTFKNDVPELITMFNHLDGLLDSKGLSSLNYFIMGQVCIDKNFRKKGVFRGLYNFMKSELKSEFDAVITEVNVKNRRSSDAHKAIGFEALDIRSEGSEDWELIILHL
ncbi:N-acetyltransferase [Winogradskyella sp. A3E31]|uniref:N-acetyltransferase n=1 Tax=Winogradskyella sp. A3E31 TaxID=3349637 RepID=UPI00398B2E8A